MIKILKKFYPKGFFSQWMAFFTPPALVIIAASAYYYHSEKEKWVFAISTHETAVVNIGAYSIEQSLESVRGDLAYLSHHHDFRMYLNNSSSVNQKHFYEDFIFLMKSRGLYDQIRWIDETGMERIRCDWKGGNPKIIPEEALQNKANRYYFTESTRFPLNALYFSPFDLNVDNNKIESPHKPMIRIATPLSDAHGVKRGIFIINYLGSHLLDKFSAAMSVSYGESMFLNPKGYWLKGAKPTDEWGFMFKRNDLTLAHTHPQVWKRIAKEKNGQFKDKEGLWTFQTLYPLKEIQSDSARSTPTENYQWEIVTFVPSQKLYLRSNDQLDILFIITGIALLFSGLWSFGIVFLSRKEKTSQEKLLRLSTIVEQINDHVTVTNKDGIITYVNPAFFEYTGYSADEVIGKTPRISKSGRYQPAFYQKLWSKIMNGEVYQGTLINKKKNGDIYYESKTITPLRDEEQTIIGFISIGRDVTEESLVNQEFKHFATIDPLTGLYNRYKFEELFALEEERTKRFGQPLSLILIDIDHFKAVNDTYGHDVGDEVIKTLAHILQENTRKIDSVARWGGEEFLILSPNTGWENIQELAEKLRLMVEKASFPEHIPITISLGIGTRKTEDTFSDLFKRADQGLYAAKKQGRNQVGKIR